MIPGLLTKALITPPITNGAPPYGEALEAVPPLTSEQQIANWKRPNVPTKVALQVGHLYNDQVPDELAALKGNTGASGGGKTEAQVNLRIAELTAEILQQQGIAVEVLPATVPPDYWADAFIAIHADGSTDSRTAGYKVAAPWRDFTGTAAQLVTLLEEEYEAATGFRKDPNITRNMRGYYAFAWWRYEHSIHPMTTAAIVETGFLTSPHDRTIIVDQPEISAQAIATGISRYLTAQGLLN